MAVTKDPVSGLEFYELSHPWGMYTPIFPGYALSRANQRGFIG